LNSARFSHFYFPLIDTMNLPEILLGICWESATCGIHLIPGGPAAERYAKWVQEWNQLPQWRLQAV
jgi:hypothetical protein